MDKLTAFLEEERRRILNAWYREDDMVALWIEHDEKLINTLLDIVGEEIEKTEPKVIYKKIKLSSLLKNGVESDAYAVGLDDIKQILTNLKK